MLKRTAFGSLLAAALLLAACSAIGMGGWTTHKDPAGFSLEIPKDWKVTNDNGRITATGPNSERVTIYPLQVEGQLDANRAQRLMVGVSNQMWPGQKWQMPKSGWQFGSNGVRAIGADQSKLRETTALWWANTGQRATGFFYAVAAPPASFEKLEPVFARILKSFRVTEANAQAGGGGGGGQGGRGSDPLAGLQFQRWTDPNEGAYTVEVPAGWRVSGGIKRLSPTNRVSETVAQSPDGIVVRSGDVREPHHFMELNQVLINNGAREGQWESGGAYFILRFLSGVQYAEWYIQKNVAQTCSNIEYLSRRDRPDFIQSLASQGFLLERNQYSAGEVIFTCQAGGKPYVGYLFVATTINPNPGVGNAWTVERLQSFMAPPDRASQADAILQKLLASLVINPQWWEAERLGDRLVYEQNQRAREFSANLQQQTQNERWAAWERRTEQTKDILGGQTQVQDPETREIYKVQHTSNYYWIDTRNEVIAGTNIAYKPTWDFREMVQTYR